MSVRSRLTFLNTLAPEYGLEVIGILTLSHGETMGLARDCRGFYKNTLSDLARSNWSLKPGVM